MRGPVHLGVRMRGDQRAVGAIEHVEKAVLVRLDHDLAQLAGDLNVGKHVFVDAVDVVDVIRRVLVVAGELAGLRANRDDARGVQAVERVARARIVRLGVAGAPVDEVELRIVRARSPGGPPPCFHASLSFGHVSEPGSPGAGIV